MLHFSLHRIIQFRDCFNFTVGLETRRTTDKQRKMSQITPRRSPVLSQDSVEFASSGTRVPKKVVREISEADGIKHSSRALGITIIHIESTSCSAFRVLQAFIDTLHDEVDDPVVSISHCVSPAVEGEAWTIIDTYSRLRSSHFVGGALPTLPPPAPLGSIIDTRFHHSMMALSGVFSRISCPMSPKLYPAIHALPLGTALCTLRQSWAQGTNILTTIHRG